MVHLGLKMVLERTEKAVEINAKNAAAWHYLILSTVPYNTESESISLRYFRQAVREIPDYYWIYEAYQRSLFWHASAKRISHFYQTYVSIRAEQYPHLNFLYAENHIMSAFAAEMTKDAIDHIYKDAPVSRFLEHLVWGTSSSRKYLKNRSVWEEIENSFHKAHAYKPENLYFMKRYSAAALNAQKTKIAQIYLDRMIAIDPTYDIYTIIRAGYLEQKKKNFNEAIAYYQMAVKLFPEHRHALGALGFVYTQNNQWPESAQIYQKLTKIYPKRMYWANLCASLARVKQYDNAHKACDKAIEIDPAEPWSYHLKGWVYKWQGQNEKGEEYIKHAKAIGWKGYPKY